MKETIENILKEVNEKIELNYLILLFNMKEFDLDFFFGMLSQLYFILNFRITDCVTVNLVNSYYFPILLFPIR